MKKKTIQKRLYGIQKKLLLYTMLLIGSVLILGSIGISAVVGRHMKKNATSSYGYVNDRFYRSFEALYEQLNVLTETCITNVNIQNSLKNRELTAYDKDVISRTLEFLGTEYTDYYVYLDNKANFYSKLYLNMDQNKLYDSYIYQGLGTDYSKVKLFWEPDVFKSSKTQGLFAARYVHQFDRFYDPGIIYIKLDPSFTDHMVKSVENPNAAFFLIDSKGQICYQSYPDNLQGKEQVQKSIEQEIVKLDVQQNQIESDVKNISQGISFAKKHEATGFTIVTVVASSVINQVIFDLLWVIVFIFLIVLVLAFFISHYFTKQFTKPIRYISSVMENFDNLELADKMKLDTNTELDDIGKSYHKMLNRISGLIGQVTFKERELRKAELDTLLYQIQPHFLYNTLDTVYVLARISKEETIMKMIQALSKYLRINLSNGAEEITIEEELEQVKSYMDIQKIRNSDLFEYTISCSDRLKGLKVIKMILQPIVENSIKHGFQELEGQGHIHINIKEMDGEVVFAIENNGAVMSEKEKERLNRMQMVELSKIDQMITKEQSGYGISNVVKRLRLRYEDHTNFYYVTSAHKTTCIIKIKKEMIDK